MDKNRNQEQPNQNQKSGQQNQNQGKHDRKNDPVASGDQNPSGFQQQNAQREGSQTTGQQSQQPGRESGQQGGQSSGQSSNPVTNQDEQRKSTNAGTAGPMAEEETEGDQQDERLKPYKNVGDDSEEVERKTPTME